MSSTKNGRPAVGFLDHRVEVVAQPEIERQPIVDAPRILEEADRVELLRLEHRRVERHRHRGRAVVDEVVDAVVGDFGAAQELEVRLDPPVLEAALQRVPPAGPGGGVVDRERRGSNIEPVVVDAEVARIRRPLRAMPVLPRASIDDEVNVPDSDTPTGS